MRRAEIRHAVFGMLDEDVLIEKVPNRGMVDRRRESRKCMRVAYSKQQKRHRKKMKARVEHEHDGESEV